MGYLVVYGVSAFFCSTLFVGFCQKAAHRWGYVAAPRADRWHGRPTALLGGVGIAATVLLLFAAFTGVRVEPVLLAGAAAIFGVGLVDDLISLKPVTKLVLEIAIASLFVFFGYRLGWSSSPTVDTLLTMFWIVGLTNAFNLLDNMDGLCAGVCLVAGTAVLAASLLHGVPGPRDLYLVLLLGATAGFLLYNFNPASIFMGDSGSLFIGLNLAVLTLKAPGDTHAASNLISITAAPVLIVLVPIVDTTLVTISRWLSGRSAAQGGRDHTSHRLVAIGLSERAAVLVLWALSALGGLFAVALRSSRQDWFGAGAAVFVLAMIIFAVYLAQVRVYEDASEARKDDGAFTPVVVSFVYRRRIAEVLLDVCLIPIAYYAAYRLRFEGAGFELYFPRFLESLPLVTGVQLVALFACGAYRGIWRYFGLMDGVAFVKGVALGTLVNVSLIVFAYRFEAYSRAVFVIDGALLILLLVGSRASFRLISEFALRRQQQGERLVIYGSGDAAAGAVRDLLGRRAGRYRMLGYVDDDPGMRQVRMQGYPVLGDFSVLLAMIAAEDVDMVVITGLLDVERLERLRVACAEHHVALERLHFALDQLVAAS